MERRAFTQRSEVRINKIETPVGFLPVANAQVKVPQKIEVFDAIWDTGATNTAIASSVVKRLGIHPITFVPVGTGGGQVIAPVYLVNIVLPDNFIIPNVQVTELKELNSCDVLIGMDIIALGDFAITHKDGKACFSFRIPSLGEVDFVPKAQKHNSYLRSKAGQIVTKVANSKKRAVNRKPRPKKSQRKKK